MTTVTIGGVELSLDNAACVIVEGVSPGDDVRALLSGAHTASSLLAARIAGCGGKWSWVWCEYLIAVGKAADLQVQKIN